MPTTTRITQLSAAGWATLRTREGLALHYYNDSAHNCTYGIGTLVHLGPCTPDELQREVAPADINAEFVRRVHEAALAVRRNVPDRELTQEQFDALVSFTYNLGATGARRVLHAMNHGENSSVANQMEQYVYVYPRDNRGRRLPPRRLPGFVARRREESAPFRNQRGRQ